MRLSLTMELAQGEQKVSDSCQALKHSMEAVVEGIKSKREKLDNVFLGLELRLQSYMGKLEVVIVSSVFLGAFWI